MGRGGERVTGLLQGRAALICNSVRVFLGWRFPVATVQTAERAGEGP